VVNEGTAEEEACLVETGARMHGCSGPRLIEVATGGLSLHNVLVSLLDREVASVGMGSDADAKETVGEVVSLETPEVSHRGTAADADQLQPRSTCIFDPAHRYQLEKYAFEVDLHNFRKAGTLMRRVNEGDRIGSVGRKVVSDRGEEENPIFQVNAEKYQVGDHIPLTSDLNDEPGTFLLAH